MTSTRRTRSPAASAPWWWRWSLVGLQGLLTLAVIAGARRSGGGQPAPATTGLAAGPATGSVAAWSVAAAAAVMSILAYGLVLWAQTRGALAAVAALRESSVIVAAGIGVLFFKEPLGRLRVLASVAVAAGVVLLATPGA